MYEWNEAIQKMIDWIEDNLCENPSLLQMSKQIGYSPYYCSVRFREITGMTIKSYMAGRRLTLAALALRDTDERI
ncbi:MAG: AraC family transcriptional regulator, partial [Oscillospiraceae bacterium]|nr:AraC family transcriptional regulator [Oscillospiraceae bacterium]